MCWRCAEIDKEIDHYRCLCARVADQGNIKSLHILIEELKVEKARVHIEGSQWSRKRPRRAENTAGPPPNPRR